jgi:hypothetical protein
MRLRRENRERASIHATNASCPGILSEFALCSQDAEGPESRCACGNYRDEEPGPMVVS